MNPATKIMTIAEAAEWASEWKRAGRTLAVTNGVFDLLHRGHVEYLALAAAQADGLLVAINSDNAVKKLKGLQRPIVAEQDRAFLLASLECVSCVVIFDDVKAIPVFKAITPDVYVKGGDYTEDTLDREEHALLKAGGARFSFIKFIPGRSTTTVIKQIQSGSTGQPAADRRIEPILARRSIRKYQLRPVGEEQLSEIIKAAMAAPSASSGQPCSFKVITGPRSRRRLSALIPEAPFIEEAPALICIIGDSRNTPDTSLLVQDCAAAAENMLLAASMLGLGACWVRLPGRNAAREFAELFGLSVSEFPAACIAVGWPGESKPARTRYAAEAVQFYRD